MKQLTYLGPPGTFSEEAAIQYNGDAGRNEYSSILEAARAVERELADQAVLPIENTESGSVNDTLDYLIHESSLSIVAELVIPIRQSLIVKPQTEFEEIKVIRSKPQALEQCTRFLAYRLPNARLEASLSTAEAVRETMEGNGSIAAVAHERAAELYGAVILEDAIEDNPNNVTRFVVLGREKQGITGADKTSVCFAFDGDAPGLLHTALGEFAGRSINLAKVESRPTRERLGRYVFLIDLIGHQREAKVSSALEAVRSQASLLKVLGSYPQNS
tara:strand:+ start:367 stop:1188 length:822 start_codon:yes stop_codon:yes gene_type:complete